MKQIDDSESVISFDVESLFGNLIPNNENTDIEIWNEISEGFAGFSLPTSSSYISILERNPQGNISMRMIVHEVNFDDNQQAEGIGQTMNQLMKDMEGTVQLRGELTPKGAIASFYLEQKQRNLLAMFFELPTYPVYVGDTWSIDVNCISMGNGFIADEAHRINQVKFTELSTTEDGRPIAILDYLIAEMVEGSFETPLSEESTPTSMSCTFMGRGAFLIEEGRWSQFTGEFGISSTGFLGFLGGETIQQFALMPLEEIPQQYLESTR
jgi:hypothetical protein